MDILQKNQKMLTKTKHEYVCCLSCGSKIKNEETNTHTEYECEICFEERRIGEKIVELQQKRNKLNRQISTLKKATLNN